MAEYNVQINKYNANNLGYDQLYPQPMKHAETHLLNGSDPINIGGLGVSNPNLLDNSYWASPDAIIDQRGGYVVPPGMAYYSDTTPGSSPVGTTTAYYTATVLNTYWVAITISGVTYYVPITAAVRGYTGVGYTIDRWYQQPGLVTTISENGLTLICTESYNRFRHYMEGIAIAGKTVTASILTASGELIASTGVFSAGNTMRITGYNLYFRFEVESNRCVFDFFFGEGGGSITIKAAKLELGSVQTLAHQENGNWVLNDPPPNKALELEKCQRYRFKPPVAFAGPSCMVAVASNALYGNVVFPVQMRSAPSISNIRLRRNSTGEVFTPTGYLIGLDGGNDGLNTIFEITGVSLVTGEHYAVDYEAIADL